MSEQQPQDVVVTYQVTDEMVARAQEVLGVFAPSDVRLALEAAMAVAFDTPGPHGDRPLIWDVRIVGGRYERWDGSDWVPVHHGDL